MHRPTEASTNACDHVASSLMLILANFDRSANEILNGGVHCMNRCLEEVDLKLGGSDGEGGV